MLVLVRDRVYQIDFARMQTEPVARSSDLTVACIHVPIHELCDFGLTSVDGEAGVPNAANAASSHDFGVDMHAALVREHRVFARRFADSGVNIVEGRSQAGSAGFNSVRVCPRFKLGIDSRPGMRRQ